MLAKAPTLLVIDDGEIRWSKPGEFESYVAPIRDYQNLPELKA